LGAGPENPEDAFEALAVVCRRAAAFGLSLAFGKFLADQFPLPIAEFSPGHRDDLLAVESKTARGTYRLAESRTRVFGWLLVACPSQDRPGQ